MNRDQFTKQDILKAMLEDWAHWVSLYSSKGGYPSKSAGFESGYVSKSYEDFEVCTEKYKFEAIEAAVYSLPKIETEAILRCYGLSRVFVMPRSNRAEHIGKGYAELLQMAHDRLIKILSDKGICFE